MKITSVFFLILQISCKIIEPQEIILNLVEYQMVITGKAWKKECNWIENNLQWCEK